MKVQCEKCSAEYNIDDSRVPNEGLQIKCPQCSATFVVSKQEAPGTAGDLFDLGAVDLSEEPAADDSLELDLPGDSSLPDLPSAPSMPVLSDSPGAESGSSLPPLQSTSSLPPIESPSSLPDISGELTPEATPGSEGQIFDFVDQDIGADQPAEAPGAVRFRIRRKSGKIFGPFDADTINRMLAEHQLMGNEEASTDGHTYKPLGAFGEFADTIRMLMDGPSADPRAEPVLPPPEATPPPRSSVEGFDDLAEIESTPAPVGVDFAEPAAKSKSGPGAGTFALLGALVLLILVGVGLGFTQYGWFGYRLITGWTGGGQGGGGGNVENPSEPEDVNMAQAQQAFFEDNYAGYEKIIRSLGRVPAEKASAEQLYLLGLSYAAMLRNYGANEQYLQKGRQVLAKLKEKAGDSAEAKRVEAAFLILTQPARAAALLAPLTGKNSRDKESLFLNGWAMAYQKKWEQAADLLDRATIVDPDFVKAYQALGDVQSLQGDFENSMLFYQKALDKNPQHVVSALELARIQFEVKKDPEKASQLLVQVFGKHFASLAPSEKAKALAVRARIHMLNKKDKEAAADLSAAVQLMPSRGDYLAALGEFYLDQGKSADALAVFDKALKRDPKSVDARVGKARAMWKAGTIVEAKILLEKTSKEAPKDPRPYFLLGKIAEDLIKPDEALASYKKAVELSPSFVEARVAKAKLLLKQGDMKRALDELTKAAKTNPRSAVVRDGLGSVYLQQDNLRLAKREFEEALKLDPDLASAHFNLGNVLARTGKHQKALEEYQKVAELDPGYPDLAYEQGYALFLMKKYPEALKMYEEAIRKNPKDDRLYVRAGLAAEAAGDTASATNYYQSATGLNSKNVDAYFYLGVLYQKQKNYEQALDLLRQVVEMDPKNADAHYYMGLVHQGMETTLEAIDEFRAAIKHNPKHVDASLELGRALVKRLQFDEAIRCFKRVVREQPGRVDVLEALGNAYFQQNLPKKALKTFLRAYKKNPRLPGLAYRIGRAYDDMEKKSKAVQFYAKAIKFDPQNPMPHYYLGYIYKAKRQNRKAISEFKTYLRMRPDAPDAVDVQDEIDYLRND